MANDVITYKAHDTGPALQVILTWGDGTRVDLTGASVVFSMRDVGRDRIVIYRRPVTIVEPMFGQLEVAWQADDFALPGDYDAEFEVAFANGEILTFPSSGYLRIRVEPDLG